MAELDVAPGDLLRFADAYSELTVQAAQISPQAVAHVQEVAETHRPIGYSTAVGVAVGMARAEGPLQAKVADFNSCARRFNEHAATYVGADQAGAQRLGAIRFHHAPSSSTSGRDATPEMGNAPITISPVGYVVWCEPDTGRRFGFLCQHLHADGSVRIYWSQWDQTGGW